MALVSRESPSYWKVCCVVPSTPKAGTALVEFYAVGSDLLAFVVTAGGLHLRRVAPLERVTGLADVLSFQLGTMMMSAEYADANLDRLRVAAGHTCPDLGSFGLTATLKARHVAQAALAVPVPHATSAGRVLSASEQPFATNRSHPPDGLLVPLRL